MFLIVSYPYTLIIDVPLKCFKNVNTTSRGKVLFGKNGCLSTVARVGAMMFSGAKALARNMFDIRTVSTTRNISRGRLLRLVTSVRDFDGRPVTGTVIGCTRRRDVSLGSSLGVARFTKCKVGTMAGNGRMCMKGTQLLSGCNVSFPCRVDSVARAVILYTVRGGCLKCLSLTSAPGPSTMRTVHRLGSLGVGGVRVLSKSGRAVISGLTRGVNIARTFNSLLPRNGMTRLRRLGTGSRGHMTFMKSNVGSAPMLTLDSIKVTVNNLKYSTTVRATSMIVRASRPDGITRTVGVKGRARHVM